MQRPRRPTRHRSALTPPVGDARLTPDAIAGTACAVLCGAPSAASAPDAGLRLLLQLAVAPRSVAAFQVDASARLGGTGTMTHPPADTGSLFRLLEVARDELVEAAVVIEDAAGDVWAKGYIPDGAMDEVARTAEVIDDYSTDPSLLLADTEKASLEDAIDRVGQVLGGMNRDSMAAGGWSNEVGLHYESLKRALDSLDAIPVHVEALQTSALLLRDDAGGSRETIALFEAAADALLQVIGADPADWRRLGSRRFEEILAEIWSGLGWQTVLTPPSRDGGFDIRALRDDQGTCLCYLVEAKAYRPDRPVGVQAVRHLYGVVEREKASHGVIATTSTFTRGARAEAAALRYRLTPADFDRVLDWVHEYRRLKNAPKSITPRN